MRRFLICSSVALTVAAATRLSAAPFAYVPNRGSDDVSVIDTATNTVVDTISVGAGPVSVAIDAAGTRVYVVNRGENTLSVIDTSSNTVTRTVPVCNALHIIAATGVALSTDGSRVYVGCGFFAAINMIHTTTFRNIGRVIGTRYEFVQGLPVDVPDERLYVQLRDDFGASPRLITVDATTLSVVGSIPMQTDTLFSLSLPLGLAATTSGTRIFVPHPAASMVRIFDTIFSQVRSIALPAQSRAVAVNQAATLAYVSLGNDTVAVIDATAETLLTTIPVGFNPSGLSLGSDEDRLYVANTGDDSVTVIDTATRTVVTSIPVGDQPIAIGRFIARPAGCGDGVIDDDELCDAGDLNATDASCCAADCTPARSGLPCADDANPCTSDICNAVSQCLHQPQAASCDDFIFCNGADSCLDGACSVHAGDPCAGGPECNDRCNESNDNCVSPNGTLCDQGLGIHCDNPDRCNNGVCVGRGGDDADGDLVCLVSDICPDVPNPTQANGDGDNYGDACDLCFNVNGARTFLDQPNPTLMVWRSGATLGEDELNMMRLAADFRLPATTTFSALPLLAAGARIVFIDDVYKRPVDAVLPGGALTASGEGRGWRLGSGGKRWLYRDRTATPIGGIRSIALTDRSAVSPGLVRIRMRGAGQIFNSGELPEDLIVVLGGAQASASGLCGESAYTYPYDCRFEGEGIRRWRCRITQTSPNRKILAADEH